MNGNSSTLLKQFEEFVVIWCYPSSICIHKISFNQSFGCNYGGKYDDKMIEKLQYTTHFDWIS